MTNHGLDVAFTTTFDNLVEDGDPEPGYSISVQSDLLTNVDELARIARRPNDHLHWSTAQRLRNAGFRVTRTPGAWERDRHCDLFLEAGPTNRPTTFDLVRLQAAFTGPIENRGKPDPQGRHEP